MYSGPAEGKHRLPREVVVLPTETIQEMPYEYPATMCIDCLLETEKTRSEMCLKFILWYAVK